MDQRLVDLETRLAFQEHTLQQLNDVIVDLRGQLDTVTQRLRLAEDRLRAIEPVAAAGVPADEKPPHY